ncbi:MAG TPA: transcriptional regulator, partial [Acetobacteraceae bacterium]|nr:transcriptional regulator [Acetobacteraceae bacterium]
LMVLIESPGSIVSKDDLMARVWPSRVVTEANLQTQILALRQALGADRGLIRTVAGRGYQFIGDIQIVSPDLDKLVSGGLPLAADDAIVVPTNLPQPVSELIGRVAEIEEISNLVSAGRLVTLAGTGGIGKSRLAIAAARQLLPQFPDGVWLAEFSPLSDPSLVPATVATSIGLELGGGELSAQRVAQALATRRLLLVLDTCEHLIDAAAAMAEALLRTGTTAQIIATSREPLRAEGEQLYRVPPLAVPADGAEDLSEYGAVRLFIERARAAESGLMLNEHQAATIAAICRRLDGIPLAIEMAAARVATLGVEELAKRIDDRLHLLTGGRRTALPRHQTLRETLDWSHELLAESERVLLRYLSVFAGAFSLEAVGAVMANVGTASPEVVDGLSSLVAKSLVVAEVDASHPRYRLLDTTRAYAAEKLAESGERAQVARRHAEYYRDLFERVEVKLKMRPTTDWLADYRRQIDDLRSALDWAFSAGGDVEIGAALTAAAAPLWMLLSLTAECRGHVERALATMAAGASGDARREMKLHAALGTTLLYASDATLTAIRAAWTRALETAERLDDVEYQLRSLWGCWALEWISGRHRAALTLAQKFRALAASRSDPNDRLVGERLIGVSQHFLGDQTSARHHLEQMLAHYVPPVHKSHIIHFQSDQRAAAGAFLGRALWLQGFPDQAIRTIERSVDDARASNHANSLYHVLNHGACPIAVLNGDLGVADRYTGMLIDLLTKHSLTPRRALGHGHLGTLAIKRGDIDTGLQLLRSCLGELGEVSVNYGALLFLCAMAEALGRVRQAGEGLSALEEVIVRTDETDERWAIAELLRIKGELLILQGAPGAAAIAEDHFRQALDWARRQGALSWELRTATSFSRLLRDQGQPADAVALLRPVYDRFTEGFDTADLKAAKALLRDLDQSS